LVFRELRGNPQQMNIAKISTKGQVTLPIDVRRKLNLIEGDHLLISEENGRYYIDNAEHVQDILSKRVFAYTSEDLEAKLDEADRQAAETQTRYSADEVFDRTRRIIRAGA
jgi:antitoxin PrlF